MAVSVCNVKGPVLISDLPLANAISIINYNRGTCQCALQTSALLTEKCRAHHVNEDHTCNHDINTPSCLTDHHAKYIK